MMRKGITLGIALFGLALGSFGLAQVSGDVIVDGSSTVAPITIGVAEEFRSVEPGINVSVGISGTSGGFRRFCPGETDMSDASRAMKASELGSCAQNNVQFIELPVAFDGLTVTVSRHSQIFSGPACLTVGELKVLWRPESQGIITRWNQVRSELANRPIVLSGAAPTSGTFDFFTEVINGQTGASRTDYFGTEDDELLARQVSQEPFGLGYFGFAFYVNNVDLVQPVAIDPRKETLDELRQTDSSATCTGVLPAPETIASFAYTPLSRPLFIYVNANSAARPEVSAFVDFYLSEEILGNEIFMSDVGYVILPEEARELTRRCWANRVTGTAFAGNFAEFAGQNITDILETKNCG
ncbi:MAG: PstS family phosphate ABC transporter substrate-binding protein [Deinococcus sp.]|nr:PstS family phosphate ABC transporter substrate-binding protein [Deinococcus sp.]